MFPLLGKNCQIPTVLPQYSLLTDKKEARAENLVKIASELSILEPISFCHTQHLLLSNLVWNLMVAPLCQTFFVLPQCILHTDSSLKSLCWEFDTDCVRTEHFYKQFSKGTFLVTLSGKDCQVPEKFWAASIQTD